MTLTFRRLAMAFAVAVAAVAAPTGAQQAASSNASPSNVSAAAGAPTFENARVAARPLANANATEAQGLTAQRRNVGRPVALMVVGFGALLAGAIIGDDVGTVFMVGGALIGLVGLYEYLK